MEKRKKRFLPRDANRIIELLTYNNHPLPVLSWRSWSFILVSRNFVPWRCKSSFWISTMLETAPGKQEETQGSTCAWELSVFPANISWSIRSCYLSLPVVPHVSPGHYSCSAALTLKNSSEGQVWGVIAPQRLGWRGRESKHMNPSPDLTELAAALHGMIPWSLHPLGTPPGFRVIRIYSSFLHQQEGFDPFVHSDCSFLW